MIIDTSAIIAVFQNEDSAASIRDALRTAVVKRIAAPTLVEITAVIEGKRDVRLHYQVKRFLELYEVETVAFTAEHAEIAQRAYRDYGRGSRSPAKLNLGDCFSYALASATNEPLLYTGDDFSHTDIVPAVDRTGNASA